ncbi:MAG: metal ABC transporter permease [Bacteroidales bacterium]|nr:metal ABC transporter permease [Bacteroidales bacterium]
MHENIVFLAPPVLSCIISAGILGYYGNHILSRGIIFIDIAVAQVAALGTMIGLLLGYAEESMNVQLISYVFTILVLLLFSLIRVRKQRLPREAIIGIFYCIALGMALLLAEKIPGGSNFITKTITGNILWVTWGKVLHCTILFAVIGTVLFIFEKRIRNLTLNQDRAGEKPLSERWPDLLFYVTFGIVIVKTVPIQGIFLVFILLIAPAAIAGLLVSSWQKRIFWSWIIGAAGSVMGISLSFMLNISNGPAIVCILGLSTLIIAFLKLLMKKRPAKEKL